MERTDNQGSPRRRVGVLLISFMNRREVSGGTLFSRGLVELWREAVDPDIVDVFQDDPVRILEWQGLRIAARGRGRMEKFLRMVLLRRLGRHAYQWKRMAGAAEGECWLVLDGSGYGDLVGSSQLPFDRVIGVHQNYEPKCTRDLVVGKWWAPAAVAAARHAQRTLWRRADQNLTVTSEDLADCVQDYGPPRRAEVLGYFEEPVELPPVGGMRSAIPQVLVSGNLEAPKGYLGLVEFLDWLGAQPASERKEVRLVVAGRNPGPAIRDRAATDLFELVANPPEIAPLASVCSVYLNPNYTGSGIKVRNLDGLRHGLPVVCRRENAAGFRHLPPTVFREFSDWAEGWRLVVQLAKEAQLAPGVRLEVWSTYRREFSHAAGVARLQAAIAPLLV